MSINLSDLTSPNNQDVLAEITSAADFLDPIGKLENLSRGSNKGGHALQTVALNQPRALPLIKNPAGDLGGYLYIPNASGNYATGPSVTIGANETWEAEVDMVITQISNYIKPLGGGAWTGGFGLAIRDNGGAYVWSKTIVGDASNLGITLGTCFNIKYGFDGTQLFVEKDGTRQNLIVPSSQVSVTQVLQLNQQTLDHSGNYAIQKAKLTVNNAVVFDCDFNGSTSIRHGDTKFQASVGGPVSLTRAGQDPATIIKKPVLRFSDAANTGLQGLFNQTITEGYFFAAFRVLGDGGESLARIFSANSTGAGDFQSGGFTLRRFELNHQIQFRWNGGSIVKHNDVFNGESRGILLESPLKDGDQNSKINNADANNGASAFSGTVSSEEFGIGSNTAGDGNAAIDLEYLALFPSSITDDQADSVRSYINNRNNVFSLVDGFGYYFFDAQNAPVGNISSGSSSWNGRIVGSDNGDTDKLATQGTSNDAPVGDGFKVTFADNTDHLEIPSTTQAGWQVVGTSLGTFAYRVDNDAVTALHLLGNNAITAEYRKAGDLYGVLLLPTSATGSDIAEAKKLLTDRGATEQAEGSNYYAAWYQRRDIIEFSAQTFPHATNFGYAWATCISMTDFGAIQAPLGNFSSAWRGCSALTSFPSGAKLGTEANNVNFSEAWRSSGLTSFPALDLSQGANFNAAFLDCTSLTTIEEGILFGTAHTTSSVDFGYTFYGCTSLAALPSGLDMSRGDAFNNAWQSCTSLQSFPADAKLGTEATGSVNFSNAWRQSGLTSFPALDLSNGTVFSNAWRETELISFPAINLQNGIEFVNTWYNCTSLLSFGNADLNGGKNFSSAWRFCTALEDFPPLFTNWNPASIQNTVFNVAWDGCTSLTAQSVENILTSIDASGKYATSTGASGGTALTDVGIDIDYNVSTGSLSAATNSAIDSLSGKGWEVYINGELVIPNILDLAPAAAYSLRSFDADADPNVVNVRRSSDSALRDFTASEVSDGTLTDWVGAGNDGHVTTWYDQGGNNDANQTSTSAQPKIVDGGALVTEGGLPALDFDGVDDELVLNTNVLLTTDPRTCLAVFTTNDNEGLIVGGNNASFFDTYGNGIYIVNSEIKGKALSNSNGVLLESGVTPNATYLVTLRLLDTDSSIYVNGTEEDTSSNNLYSHSYASQIGGGQYFNDNMDGTIQEIVVFDTDQSSNRTGIETNINDHFDIYS